MYDKYFSGFLWISNMDDKDAFTFFSISFPSFLFACQDKFFIS